MRPHLLLGLCLTATIASAGAAAAQDVVTTPEDIIGTWKLTSYTVTTGDVVNKPFGDTPGGYLVFDDALRGFVILFNQERPAPAATPATDAEAAGLFRSMVVWTAGCTLDSAGTPDGSKLDCAIDQSWNPALIGTTRSYFMKVDGDRLDVKSVTQPSVQEGKPSIAITSYVRAEGG